MGDKMEKTALVLRTCAKDGSSSHGFIWPLTVGAKVEAPDWTTEAACGHGLHGFLYGAGDIGAANIHDDGVWLALEVEEDSIVMLGGKCKFPTAIVRFVGSRDDAAAYIEKHEPRAAACAVIGAQRRVGDEGVVQVGAFGTATAGDSGTATAGYRGTATAGYSGTATAGYRGTATAGYSGTATAGAFGTATAGYSGTATAGDRGTATAGDRGTATAGDRGTATAGDSGTATAGDRGTATAGEGGVISIEWYDRKTNRYRRAIGVVGEDGIEPNVAYRCDGNGKLVPEATTP